MLKNERNLCEGWQTSIKFCGLNYKCMFMPMKEGGVRIKEKPKNKGNSDNQ